MTTPTFASTNRNSAALANIRPSGISTAPAAAIKAPSATTNFKIPPTNSGLAFIHSEILVNIGLTTSKISSKGCFSVLPASAMMLNMRLCCMMS
ncbi:hypothetical protein D3C72_1908390 [compost metagenome]